MATLPFWLMGRAFRKVCNMATLGHRTVADQAPRARGTVIVNFKVKSCPKSSIDSSPLIYRLD
jgi:hypothetical protein